VYCARCHQPLGRLVHGLKPAAVEMCSCRRYETFSTRIGTITDTTLLITELFTDTVMTTNYDRLIEQAFDTGAKNAFEVIAGILSLGFTLNVRSGLTRAGIGFMPLR
jgi:hypothetical protein